ncbi:levanase/fructan beta-fructosidase [Salimicrobium salexigens]|uniref:Levanase/fructan beta-fructosidase n=1 Tax=Salimicrobium salexigens TaxID=908941 RepID=A0ABY1KVE8_9BACI|nr:levanase/fructan beta-fructosidase [Salimicrobium salexigens]
MLVSIGDEPGFDAGSRTQYFVGTFDGKTFEPGHEDVRWLDVGKDNYAGVSFSDVPASDGRRIYIGWMSNWQYANQVPTHGWRSQMTLPRTLELEGDRLVQRPVKELEAYFVQGEPAVFHVDAGSEEQALPEAVEYLQVRASLENKGAERFGLVFHYEDDQSVVLQFDGRSGRMVLDRRQSGYTGFFRAFQYRAECFGWRYGSGRAAGDCGCFFCRGVREWRRVCAYESDLPGWWMQRCFLVC